MPIYKLHPDFIGFPPRTEFEGDLIAVGGDLRRERLIEAYKRGVFPWYNEPGKLRWYSPDERCVLPVASVQVSHSMRNLLNKRELTFTMDKSFSEVVEACREGERQGQTWIHDEIVNAYSDLHAAGYAHSLEVWKDGRLVGGLYGVSIGSLFFGESMFSRHSNASKAALIQLCRFLPEIGIELIDCQVPNDHLISMGAEVWHRDDFLDTLEKAIAVVSKCEHWQTAFQDFHWRQTNNGL
jgi:leucyl/phenylalanyl-tRNA--protein transferase